MTEHGISIVETARHWLRRVCMTGYIDAQEKIWVLVEMEKEIQTHLARIRKMLKGDAGGE